MLLEQKKQALQMKVTVKNPNWEEVNQLAIYKAWRGFKRSINFFEISMET